MVDPNVPVEDEVEVTVEPEEIQPEEVEPTYLQNLMSGKPILSEALSEDVKRSPEYQDRMAGEEGPIRGLAPDVTQRASEEQMPEVFQPQDKTFLGEATGLVSDEAVARAQQQDALIARSRGYYMLPENPQDINDDEIMEQMYVEFPLEGQDINYKKRNMFRNGAGYLRAVDEEGNFIKDEYGRYAFVPLSTTEELEGYTTPYEYGEGEWTADVGQAVRDVKEVFTGPSGAGDMKAIDTKLKNLGMTNPIARTITLRGIATGRWNQEVVTRQLQDLGAFVATIPSWLPKVGSFLTVDVAMQMTKSALADSPEAYQEWNVAQEQLTQRFDKASEAMDLAKTLGILNGIETASDGKYDPQIMEEILAPRGYIQTLMSYAGPELAVVGPWAVIRTSTAAMRNKRFGNWLKREYGTDDIAEATEKAFANLGPDEAHPQIVKNYLDSFNGQFMGRKKRNKAATDIDIVMGLRAMFPGETRDALLKQEMRSLDDQLERAQSALDAARKTNNKDAIKTQTAAVRNIAQQRDRVYNGILVPKYYKDLFGEARLTVGAQAAFITLGAQYFGDTPKQEDLLFYELAGAGVTMLNGTASMYGAQRLHSGVVNGMYDVMSYLGRRIDTLGDKAGWDLAVAEWAGSRKAQAALKMLARQPSQFQMAFVNGLRQTAEIRRRIMEISAATGKDIDPDLMITNLATMSGIAEMMDINRQLDTKITATSLDEIAPVIMDKQNATNGMLLLVNQLADTAAQLTDLKIAGNLADDDPISLMAAGLTRVASAQKALLNEERAIINEMVSTNREGLEALLQIDLTNGIDDGDSLELVQKMFDLENEIAISNLSTDAKTALGAQQQEFLQVNVKRIKDIRANQLATLKRITNSLNFAEAASGRASQLFGSLGAFNRSYFDSEAARRYTEFDLKNPDTYANVNQQFDEIMGEGVPMDFIDVGDPAITQGIAKMRNETLIPKDRRAFALLFDGAAANGFARLRREFGTDEAWNTWLSARGIDTDGTQIEQFVELRNLARKGAGGDEEALKTLGDMSAEDAQVIVDELPLLISASDWRKVNSYLGKTQRKASAQKDMSGRAATYGRFYKSWNNVGEETIDGAVNPSAFRTGWDTDEPQVIAEEVMGEFRDIQEWYRVNIAERYYTDKNVRNLDAQLTGKGKKLYRDKEGQQLVEAGELDDEELIERLQATMQETDAPNMPIYWLDNLIGNGKVGQVLTGEKLYQGITRPLAKMGGGVYHNGKYVFVVGGTSEADQIAAQSAEQMRVILTRHLQGRVAGMLGDQVLPRDAKGRLLFEELDKKLEIDTDLIESMLNIPVYERNAAGELVQAVDQYGNPRFLLDENEVYSSISLGSLERNRLDLKETFEEAGKVVDNQMDEVDANLDLFEVNAAGERIPVGARAQLEYEQAYSEDLIQNLFRLRGKETSGGELIFPTKDPVTGKVKANMDDASVRQYVFDRFVSSENSVADMNRLRDMMVESGQNPEHVDYFIKRMVRDHILSQTQRYGGKKHIITPEGVHVELPDMEVSATEIFKLIGRKGTPERANLDRILGADATDTLELIAETIRRMDPAAGKSGIEAYSPSMSLDSVLSRLYNINRGVVSVQWVATESIIRAAKMHQNTLLKVMLEDRDAAREVLRIIETGEIPPYKVQPNWIRLLVRETAISEARNRGRTEGATMAASLAGAGQTEYAGIEPYYGTPEEPQEAAPTLPQQMTELDIERKQFGIAPSSYQQQIQQRKQGTLQ